MPICATWPVPADTFAESILPPSSGVWSARFLEENDPPAVDRTSEDEYRVRSFMLAQTPSFQNGGRGQGEAVAKHVVYASSNPSPFSVRGFAEDLPAQAGTPAWDPIRFVTYAIKPDFYAFVGDVNGSCHGNSINNGGVEEEGCGRQWTWTVKFRVYEWV
ncbi:uncharacterized protein PADG_05165 [Paracoccidioides brasiliensis Pb18]|uniref:Uncharacterized protein n=2 Tax=Paracoccidioides brasiliensis TaxID=121759 RepID=C1GD29_PARBD|nr:uncharacterized protein PADG_05165 [Paracoccidioides brasiliensis Pb18]EEH49086.2 hypothetical protein PADG_05165 [Paracoccidioides brasiliensis Pb18]ODH34376.1 hypothetical protein ACO22_03123 [Paracoccidioides brasiliensis]